MAFVDLDIASLRMDNKESQSTDITLGRVVIGNTVHQFERRTFFNASTSLLLPTDFVPMADDIAQLKYPSQFRPSIILSSEDTTVNITLEVIQQSTSNLTSLLNELQTVIAKLNPSICFLEKVISKSNEYGYFEYSNSALDGDIYNILFVLPGSHTILLGTFNCKLELMDTWSSVAKQIICVTTYTEEAL